MESLDIESLPAQVQSRILGKLNFMDDILIGKIDKPPGMTINTAPSPLDALLKSVKSKIKLDNDDDESKCEPSSVKPPTLFDDVRLQKLETLNQQHSNPIKYPLTNNQILSIQNDGYVVIDDYLKDKELMKHVQNEIDLMNKNGKMKRAGLRRLNTDNDKENIEIIGSATNEINGIYEYLSYIPITIQHQLNKEYKILSDICYIKNNEYGIINIETTGMLSLFVTSCRCWIIFKKNIIYYVAQSDGTLDELDWKCIGGILPFGKIINTNKWISSSVRSDLHCWLHSDDKDIGYYLKKCIVSMDEIRVQLNKLLNFESNTTQVQATLYPGNGSKYVTHLDEPPNVKKKNAKGQRKLTCLMYFNLFDEEWDSSKYGGCLRIYLGNGVYRDIEPFGGRLVLFNSQWLPHQVLPCHFNRYAVTLWMY